MAETIDTNSASVARAYDYLLGGKDNFDVDRQFAESIAARDPEFRTSIRLNRQFGARVVEYMSQQGIRQFLDLGSGIPTSPPSVHETARKTHPHAHVVYVDHDPVVSAHNRALRATSSGLTVIDTSFTDLEAIFAHPDCLANLDLSQPVGILTLSVFQNTLDDSHVREILDSLRGRLVPGSYLAMSHASDQTAQVVQDQIAESSQKYGYPAAVFRTRTQIENLYTGWDLVAPGVVDYRDWPEPIDDRPTLNTHGLGAVGRLP